MAHNALLLGSVSSGMCSVTMETMTGRVRICESICRHKIKRSCDVWTPAAPQFPPKANLKPWSLIGSSDRNVIRKRKKKNNPKTKQPIVFSGDSSIRWWTWKRRREGAGCGPAGDRAARSEPRWPPPPTPAASAPSSCPSCDGREVTSSERKGEGAGRPRHRVPQLMIQTPGALAKLTSCHPLER